MLDAYYPTCHWMLCLPFSLCCSIGPLSALCPQYFVYSGEGITRSKTDKGKKNVSEVTIEKKPWS